MMILWQVSVKDFVVFDMDLDDCIPFGYYAYERVQDLPGLYYFYLRDKLLYVGMSTNLKSRLGQHCTAEKNKTLWKYFDTYQGEVKIFVEYYDEYGEEQLRRKESDAILNLRPLVNVQGKANSVQKPNIEGQEI